MNKKLLYLFIVLVFIRLSYAQIKLDQEYYYLGETVNIGLIDNNYEVSIEVKETGESYRFLGPANGDLKFTPKNLGIHQITLHINNKASYSKTWRIN